MAQTPRFRADGALGWPLTPVGERPGEEEPPERLSTGLGWPAERTSTQERPGYPQPAADPAATGVTDEPPVVSRETPPSQAAGRVRTAAELAAAPAVAAGEDDSTTASIDGEGAPA